MAHDFLPHREAELVTWLATFKALISATPVPYGLTAPQVTAYGTLYTAFTTAYALANADATRSPSNIIAKDQAKKALIDSTRQLASVIQSNPTTTNQQRSDLGLTVPAQPQPVPTPADSPILEVVATDGNTVRIRLHDKTSPNRRGKPAGVSGASVFSFVGAQPPADTAVWKFEGITSHTAMNLNFPLSTAPGSKVWLTAFWFNARKESGPACKPVGANVPGGDAMAA